jgi:prepilin-type N-terminal cleavage/methylation domain-containing protein
MFPRKEGIVVKKGFTLIELLIVVAIIAILAAIAVPNFLEAQVRSKVSRAKSDQRSLATAIEAYFVDNNLYPAAAREGSGSCVAPNDTVPVNPTGTGNVNKYANPNNSSPKLANVFSFASKGLTQMAILTTPIGYITSYPADPFADTKGSTFCYFANPNGWILWSPGPDTDESQGTNLGTNVNAGTNAVETLYDVRVSQPSLALQCGIGGAQNKAFTYDPTNGTVSPGDVYRVKQ